MGSTPMDRAPAWSLAVTAMLSVQLGAAVSFGLFDRVGVFGTAWLRIALGAVGFVLIARPRYRRWRRRDLRAPVLLGIVTAGMLLGFSAAIDLLPLGTAVAIEFPGPLTMAALHSGSRRALLWPGLALVGVVLLTEPCKGNANFAGIAFAAFTCVCWGLYIVITQHVGGRFSGVDSLAVSIPVAAVASSFIGIPQAWGHIDLHVLLVASAAAVLLPIIPWTLELYALRRLTKSAFGTLMALEPAIALTIGAVVLQQAPAVAQLVGIACVVLAGMAAERRGRREDHFPDLAIPIS
jgi:inner membrane transporter RhtA